MGLRLCKQAHGQVERVSLDILDGGIGKQTMKRLLPVVAMSVVLSACDAWPTNLENRAAQPITLRYHQEDHREWSAEFDLEPGRSMTFPRGHWIQDIFAMRIRDGQTDFEYDYDDLSFVRSQCGVSPALREMTQPNCYLRYLGNGQLSASTRSDEVRVADPR